MPTPTPWRGIGLAGYLAGQGARRAKAGSLGQRREVGRSTVHRPPHAQDPMLIWFGFLFEIIYPSEKANKTRPPGGSRPPWLISARPNSREVGPAGSSPAPWGRRCARGGGSNNAVRLVFCGTPKKKTSTNTNCGNRRSRRYTRIEGWATETRPRSTLRLAYV